MWIKNFIFKNVIFIKMHIKNIWNWIVINIATCKNLDTVKSVFKEKFKDSNTNIREKRKCPKFHIS